MNIKVKWCSLSSRVYDFFSRMGARADKRERNSRFQKIEGVLNSIGVELFIRKVLLSWDSCATNGVFLPMMLM